METGDDLPIGKVVELVRAGDTPEYTIDGQKFLRVSEVLDGFKGPNLPPWYAKMAALRAASWLAHAGLLKREDPVLAEFIEDEPMRAMSMEDACMAAADWASNMREAERYRDFRAAVGSLTHYAKEALCTGVKVERWQDWMFARAMEPGFLDEEALARFAHYGYDQERVARDYASHADRHWRSLERYLRLLKPRYHPSGAEIVVCHTEMRYAGTIDGDQVVYEKADWIRAKSSLPNLPDWPLPDKTTMVALEDLKTSTSIRESMRYQLAAYFFANRALAQVENADLAEVCEPGDHDAALIINTKPLADPVIKIYTRAELAHTFEGFRHMLAYVHHSREPLPTPEKRPAKPRKTSLRDRTWQ